VVGAPLFHKQPVGQTPIMKGVESYHDELGTREKKIANKLLTRSLPGG